MWSEAISRAMGRMEDTRRRVGPHWADPETGDWTTTVDGDWTGGQWVGMHWLAAKHTGKQIYRTQAAALAQGMKGRIAVDTVFKVISVLLRRRARLDPLSGQERARPRACRRPQPDFDVQSGA